MASVVLVERSVDGVATITLNRPERLNAISIDLVDELARILDDVDGDADVGCVVLTGSGRGFCSGGDFDLLGAAENAADPVPPPLSVDEEAARLAQMHIDVPLRLYELTKPTIALVNGPAAGAGLSVAAACDIRVASTSAKFTTAFVPVGRSGDFGGTFFLQRLVGRSRARELYFTSDVLDADAALKIGLVDYVYPPDEAREKATRLAERIAAGPREALASMKLAFRTADTSDLRTLLDLEARLMTRTGRSSEGQMFLDRFLASRKER